MIVITIIDPLLSMMDQPKTTQELINDLKAKESTVTKNIVGNTLV